MLSKRHSPQSISTWLKYWQWFPGDVGQNASLESSHISIVHDIKHVLFLREMLIGPPIGRHLLTYIFHLIYLFHADDITNQ